MRNAILAADVVGLVLLSALPVAAQQAMSRSMVECSVIYAEVAEFSTSARHADRREEARGFSGAFARAALDRAAAEGQPDPAAYVAEQRHDLADKWSGRFESILKFDENREWLTYCRTFGRSRGLL